MKTIEQIEQQIAELQADLAVLKAQPKEWPQVGDGLTRSVEMILTDEEAQKIFESEHCRISKELAGILARSIEAEILAMICEPVAWREFHGWMHTGVKISPTDTPLYRIPEVK